jgi:hypothetical protein
LLEQEVARLDLGAAQGIFEKPGSLNGHMKHLYTKGHIDGTPVNWMLVDGGACVNIMLSSLFKKLGSEDCEPMKTNMTLSGFFREASEAKGIVSGELTVNSKTIPMAFFVVVVKGKYNILLECDWIHADGCVPSTVHQCIVQWIGDEVEVVMADDTACVVATEMHEDLQDREVCCLSGRDLSGLDYISVGKHGFMLVNVKPTVVGRLENIKFSDGQ